MAILDGIEYTREDIIQAIYDLGNNKYNELDFKTQDIRNSDYQIVWQEKLYTAKRVFECLAKNKNIVISSSFQSDSLIPQLREMGFKIKEQSKFGNRKDGFLEYLKNVILPTTASYKNYIKKFDLDKIIMYILKKDIFAISDVNEIEFIFSQLKGNEEWKAYNKQNGNGIPAAILRKHYKNYIEQEEMKLTNLSAKDLRQKLIAKYQTKIEINDKPKNYTAFVYSKKNIAEIHYIEKFKDEFKIVLNYEKLNDVYKASVERVPDSWGWTLNGIFRINSVDSYKTAIGMIDYILNNNIKQKYWLYAAGEKSAKWEEFYNEGIMALGWDYLGDYRQYNTQDDLASKIQQHRGGNKYPMNICKAIWEFADGMNIGDVIYVKQGLEPILLGRGIVASEYIYDSDRQEYKNIRKVNWTHKGQFKVDFTNLEIRQWNQKTLTDVSENKYGDFCKKIESIFKEENETKLEKNKMRNQPLNQILYGPPGTGKTYNTILKAMSIIDNTEYKDVPEKQYYTLKTRFDELKQAGQIEFVTFHQSYSYEEFVEGIKPNLNDEKLGYVLENGIFKNICDHAKPIVTTTIKRAPIDFSNTKVFKMSLGNTLEKEDDIYDYCIENNVVSLGWKDIDFSNCKTSQDFKNLDDSWGATALERFVKWMDIGDIIIISNGNRNFRAIAQVKSDYIYDKNTPISYTHFRKVEWLYKGEDIHYSKINDKIFSQQSIYGYFSPSKKGQPDYNPDLKTDELNKIITGEVNKEVSKPHILIIDEINRGDVSKIFGELITLIEEDKRIGNKYQMKITLPYSKEPFGVPNNLYIIGTMNTADRSIALLDTALRRRFDFEEIMPRPKLLNNKVIEGTNINLQTLLTRINERITNKYDRDHQIGHSYLMGVNAKEQLERAYKNRILPLLNEYFYNESKTVAEILNCSEDELKTSDFISILSKAQGA